MFASRNYSGIHSGIADIPNAIVKSEGKKNLEGSHPGKKYLSLSPISTTHHDSETDINT